MVRAHPAAAVLRHAATASPGGASQSWLMAMASGLRMSSFMMGVISRMSVPIISGDATTVYRENSVRYSASVCPGQCIGVVKLHTPVSSLPVHCEAQP